MERLQWEKNKIVRLFPIILVYLSLFSCIKIDPLAPPEMGTLLVLVPIDDFNKADSNNFTGLKNVKFGNLCMTYSDTPNTAGSKNYALRIDYDVTTDSDCGLVFRLAEENGKTGINFQWIHATFLRFRVMLDSSVNFNLAIKDIHGNETGMGGKPRPEIKNILGGIEKIRGKWITVDIPIEKFVKIERGSVDLHCVQNINIGFNREILGTSEKWKGYFYIDDICIIRK